MPEKKKIHKLKLEIEDDFQLIGIASHENDYRLSWALNQQLGFTFTKKTDLVITHPKHKVETNFTRFIHEDELEYLTYTLFSNKSEGGFLLPEFKNIDFILKVSGNPDTEQLAVLTNGIKQINIVITAFVIDQLSDKSRKLFNL